MSGEEARAVRGVLKLLRVVCSVCGVETEDWEWIWVESERGVHEKMVICRKCRKYGGLRECPT